MHTDVTDIFYKFFLLNISGMPIVPLAAVGNVLAVGVSSSYTTQKKKEILKSDTAINEI